MLSIITKGSTIALPLLGLLLIAESVFAQPIGILEEPAPNFPNQSDNETKFRKPEISFVSGGTTGVTDDGPPYEKVGDVTAVSRSKKPIDSLTITQRGFEKPDHMEDNPDSDSPTMEVSESTSTERSKTKGKDSNDTSVSIGSLPISVGITDTSAIIFLPISGKPVTLAIVSESGGPPAGSTVASKNQRSLPTTLGSGSLATTPPSDNEGTSSSRVTNSESNFPPAILEFVEKAGTEKSADFDKDPDEFVVSREVKTESRNSASGVKSSWMIAMVGIFLIRR
ncbi:uncharacterized protein LOC125500584 [Athalia rosae]|uniref:uncharacterized protein LOC125500584 n=1 Tax=Athalia rosae TaxID=37344 RepID=UPI002033B0A4|nr:uncharacterized protein LOC125500584 [Athalia rosae]